MNTINFDLLSLVTGGQGEAEPEPTAGGTDDAALDSLYQNIRNGATARHCTHLGGMAAMMRDTPRVGPNLEADARACWDGLGAQSLADR